MRLPVIALALFAAVLHPRAATAMERGSAAAARTHVAAIPRELRADALYLDARAQGLGLQRFRTLFAYDEPVLPKQYSNASWRHNGPLLVKPAQSGNELRVRRVRHRVVAVYGWSSENVRKGGNVLF